VTFDAGQGVADDGTIETKQDNSIRFRPPPDLNGPTRAELWAIVLEREKREKRNKKRKRLDGRLKKVDKRAKHEKDDVVMEAEMHNIGPEQTFNGSMETNSQQQATSSNEAAK
jgi:hypothetical protein